MTELIRYEAARAALAEARSIDEVKGILDKAEALRAYGRMASDVQLEIDATEIRMRAERRLGIMLDEAKRAGQLHTGKPKAASPEANGTNEEPLRITLADIGVDKKLSARAQKVGGIAERAFEAMVTRMRGQMAEGGRRVSLDLIKEDEEAKAREERAARRYEGGTVDHLHQLVAEGRKFSAILADPPWHFATRSDKGDGRSAGTHYKTEENSLAAMMALPVKELAADDCVLFVWMLDWCPRWALDLIEAWGFTHKTTAFTWAKQTRDETGFHFGQGYWTRANPEDCWLATRGSPKRQHADVRQLVVAPVMEHSRKPEIIHSHIERLVAGPYLELFARRPRDQWQTWGNELAFKVAPDPALPPHDPATGELIEGDASSGSGEKGEAPAGDIGGTGSASPTGRPGPEVGAPSPGPAENAYGASRVPRDGAGELTEGRAEAPAGEVGGDVSPAGKLSRVVGAPNPSRAPNAGDPSPVPGDDELELPNFLRRGDPDNAWAGR